MSADRSPATSLSSSEVWLLYVQAWNECFPKSPLEGEENPPFSLVVLETFAEKLLASKPSSAAPAFKDTRQLYDELNRRDEMLVTRVLNLRAENDRLKASTPASSTRCRKGWMIERVKPLAYWNGVGFDFDHESAWTKDPNNAPVFENDTSALVVMMALGRYNRLKGDKLAERYRIAEHKWPTLQSAMPASTFLTEVCDALFGSFLEHAGFVGNQYGYRCQHCARVIDVPDWIHAEHEADCLIPRVREYLAKHKPEALGHHNSGVVAGTDRSGLDK